MEVKPKIPWILRGRRLEIIRSISRTEGEDMDWVASSAGLSESGLAYHYRQLHKFGYVYKARFNHPEIWLTKKAWETLKQNPEPVDSEPNRTAGAH